MEEKPLENDSVHRNHIWLSELNTAGGRESAGGKKLTYLHCFSTLLQASASDHCQRWDTGPDHPLV